MCPKELASLLGKSTLKRHILAMFEATVASLCPNRQLAPDTMAGRTWQHWPLLVPVQLRVNQQKHETKQGVSDQDNHIQSSEHRGASAFIRAGQSLLLRWTEGGQKTRVVQPQGRPDRC